MTVREAEAEAEQLLNSSWWYSNGGLPVDPFHLARGLGIAVRLEPLPADESGNIVIAPDEAPVISLNQFDGENRRRFTCAHEIGHYVSRSQGAEPQRFIDFRDTLAGLGRDTEEIFANQFAAALLMPAEHVMRLNSKGTSVEAMARTFKTSVQAMELRLRNLRLDE
jgi:Zn-dependent peptidase ImmA (M78 family)